MLYRCLDVRVFECQQSPAQLAWQVSLVARQVMGAQLNRTAD